MDEPLVIGKTRNLLTSEEFFCARRGGSVYNEDEDEDDDEDEEEEQVGGCRGEGEKKS